jgi:protein involved in polysaccharide export with SLBB domain
MIVHSRLLFLFVVTALAATTPSVFAQQPSPQRPANADTILQVPPLDASGLTLLDRPFERGEYTLGPGDGVDVAMFGEINRFHRLAVTPEGTLLIPGIGVARVRGLNLDAAEDRVRAVVARQFRNVEVNVSLSRLRTFKVFLLGHVSDPGVRIASPATRVSEVVPPDADGVLRRNITVRHSDGSTDSVDLLRFVALGDLDANPRLREGDAVFVPALDKTVSAIGGFNTAGSFEHRAGETLAEFVQILNGGRDFSARAADTIRLSRLTPQRGGRQVHFFTREQALAQTGRTFVLQPFDALYLPTVSDVGLQPSATVRGQVLHPGTYPIRPDTTTVRELVVMAGGFRTNAAPAQATLTRTARPARSDPNQLDSIPAAALSDEELRIAQARAVGDPNRVVIDFPRILSERGAAYDQKLTDGDVLEVPRARLEVVVLGAVMQPGIVTHVPDRNSRHYIALAGGYTSKADRGGAVVFRSRTGARLDADDVAALEPGDQIVVPFRDDVSWTERLTRVQNIVVTLSSLVFTYLGVKQILN